MPTLLPSILGLFHVYVKETLNCALCWQILWKFSKFECFCGIKVDAGALEQELKRKRAESDIWFTLKLQQ